MEVLTLSSDTSFHFEFLRFLSKTRYRAGDINDVLQVAGTVKPGDFESWYSAWLTVAQRTANKVPDPKKYPVSACDRLFAAAHYYRAADFFLHGNPDDPRINETWQKQTEYFDRALEVFEYSAKRHMLKADDFEVPIIFYQAKESGPRPTLTMCSGYDGAQEELLHMAGLAALQRGYNVITFEGPGQPSVLRYQGKALIPDWERVVIPVVDFALQQPSVDGQRIALLGVSLGGYLSVRAAAFEHRLAAVVACDGIWSFAESMKHFDTPEVQHVLQNNPEKFDKQFSHKITDPATPTPLRWGMQQGMWVFRERSPSKVIAKINEFTLEGLQDKIQCPVLDVEAADDIFFDGQPEIVKEKLGDKATYKKYTKEDGGHLHCQLGALTLFNQDMFEWLDEKMG